MILLIDIGYHQIYKLSETIDLYDDFERIAVFDLTVEKVNELNPDAIILSHGSISIQDQSVNNYLTKLEVIKDLNIPVLGIGSGHHLLGMLYGAKGVFSSHINQMITIGLIPEDEPLFNKLPIEIEVLVEHSNSISIPPHFELLASSDACINEAMKHRSKAIYGIQFLPERSGNYGAIIIENFVNISRQNNADN